MSFMRLEVWRGEGGYFGRYSAPGYLDCTDEVGPFPQLADAITETFDMFGDRGDEGDRMTADEVDAVRLLVEAAGWHEEDAVAAIMRPDYTLPK